MWFHALVCVRDSDYLLKLFNKVEKLHPNCISSKVSIKFYIDFQ